MKAKCASYAIEQGWRTIVETVARPDACPSPWRDLPDKLGPWNSVFKRFRRRAKKGVFDRIFNVLPGEPDFEYAMIDGRIIRVHQHGMGAKRGLAIRPWDARAAD